MKEVVAVKVWRLDRYSLEAICAGIATSGLCYLNVCQRQSGRLRANLYPKSFFLSIVIAEEHIRSTPSPTVLIVLVISRMEIIKYRIFLVGGVLSAALRRHSPATAKIVGKWSTPISFGWDGVIYDGIPRSGPKRVKLRENSHAKYVSKCLNVKGDRLTG